jgi:hypothetical protein
MGIFCGREGGVIIRGNTPAPILLFPIGVENANHILQYTNKLGLTCFRLRVPYFPWSWYYKLTLKTGISGVGISYLYPTLSVMSKRRLLREVNLRDAILEQ